MSTEAEAPCVDCGEDEEIEWAPPIPDLLVPLSADGAGLVVGDLARVLTFVADHVEMAYLVSGFDPTETGVDIAFVRLSNLAADLGQWASDNDAELDEVAQGFAEHAARVRSDYAQVYQAQQDA